MEVEVLDKQAVSRDVGGVKRRGKNMDCGV